MNQSLNAFKATGYQPPFKVKTMDPSAMDIDVSTNLIIITNLKSESTVYLQNLMLCIELLMFGMMGETLPNWSSAAWMNDVNYYYNMMSGTKLKL